MPKIPPEQGGGRPQLKVPTCPFTFPFLAKCWARWQHVSGLSPSQEGKTLASAGPHTLQPTQSSLSRTQDTHPKPFNNHDHRSQSASRLLCAKHFADTIGFRGAHCYLLGCHLPQGAKYPTSSGCVNDRQQSPQGTTNSACCVPVTVLSAFTYEHVNSFNPQNLSVVCTIVLSVDEEIGLRKEKYLPQRSRSY